MNEMQRKVDEFWRARGYDMRLEQRILDTMSELGELSKEVLKATRYGKGPASATDGIRLEIGDIMYSALSVANALGVDAEEALNSALEKYESRYKRTGGVGSSPDSQPQPAAGTIADGPGATLEEI